MYSVGLSLARKLMGSQLQRYLLWACFVFKNFSFFVIFLIVAGLERFLAICYPMKHKLYGTRHIAVSVSLVMWLVCGAALSLY